MTLTAIDKGKRKAIPEIHEEAFKSGSGSSSASSSDSDTSSDSDSEEDEITPEYLESLLEKARQNAAASRGVRQNNNGAHEEDVIKLHESTKEYVVSRFCISSMS
jgi:hypothetical protein